MSDQQSWQPAPLATFNINKEGPYLDQRLSTSTTQENSYKEDVKNGYQDGLDQAQQTINEYRSTFEEIFSNFDDALKFFDEDIIQSITHLAISISKQIIRRELEINSEQVVSIVRDAIKLLPLEKNRVIVHLNPNDIAVVQKIFNQEDSEESYSLVEDISIQRGGCKLSTDSSVIDATIDSQIAQIAAKVLGSQRNSVRDQD